MRKSNPDFGSGQWFDVLKAAGNLESRKKTPFTASLLSEAANIQPTTKTVAGKTEVVSSENQIAAAWLLKLEKWGYVERVGTVKGDGPRPAITWQMTKKGRECELRESLRSRFDRLFEAARIMVAARGKKDENEAWVNLQKTVQELGE